MKDIMSPDQTRVECVGRHLVTVPASFYRPKPMAVWNRFMPEGMSFQEAPQMRVQFVSSGTTKEAFDAALGGSPSRPSTVSPLNDSYSLLEVAERLRPALYLRRFKDKDLPSDDMRNSELHAWKAGTHFAVEAESFNGRFLDTEALLLKFVDAIDVIDGVPTIPGFCIGSLLVRGTYSREEFAGTMGDPNHPDLLLGFEIQTYAGSGRPGLLERESGPSNILKKISLDYTTLKKDRLTVAGMPAEELGVRFDGEGRDGEKVVEHKFMLEVDRPDPSASRPRMTMRLLTGLQNSKTGATQTSSLKDGEVVRLWDAIVSSIRLRPGAT